MEGVAAVGAVPDEVLLLCGRPSATPSNWWTPALARLEEDDAAHLVARAAAELDAAGVRDGTTGGLTGPLGLVAEVVAEARVVLLLETDVPGAHRRRRSVVVAPERALFDLQDEAEGAHDLLLAGPAAAAGLLTRVLAPTGDGVVGHDVLGVRSAAEVATALPRAERHATTRITQVVPGTDPVVHAATVVDHPDGAVCCAPRPDGRLAVTALDADGAVGLALWLLGAGAGEVAA